MRKNPFTCGKPISHPLHFIGRQREVEHIFSRLRNIEFESSSIVGERRVGKTSLLKYIAHQQVRCMYNLDPETYIFVYVDLQMVNENTTPAQLWRRLLQKMALCCQNGRVKHVLEQVDEFDLNDTFALADIFDNIDENGLYIIFLLDEFENVTKNANFGADFFYGLRSLAINHHLSLVTSSRSELIELCHSEVIRSSPFFNIFANIYIRPFTPTEAEQLVSTALKETGVHFTDEEVDLILTIAGCHPFFLQSACFLLFEAYAQHPSTSERCIFLRKAFREEVAPHLNEYWSTSTDQEKIVLTTLALLEHENEVARRKFSIRQLRKLYAHSDQTLARLERRSLVSSNDDGYSLLNASLGQWICDEITDIIHDQQNYDEWLGSNKAVMERLSIALKKDIGEILPGISSKYRQLILAWLSDPRNLVDAGHLLKAVLGFQ